VRVILYQSWSPLTSRLPAVVLPTVTTDVVVLSPGTSTNVQTPPDQDAAASATLVAID
jgi:hypothetical protein